MATFSVEPRPSNVGDPVEVEAANGSEAVRKWWAEHWDGKSSVDEVLAHPVKK